MEKGLRERFIDPCSPRPFCFLMRFCVLRQGVGSQRIQHLIVTVRMIMRETASAVVIEMLQHKANYLGVRDDFFISES